MAGSRGMQELYDEGRGEVLALRRRLRGITTFRLLTFALFITSVWMAFGRGALWVILALVSLSAFLVLVRYHEQVKVALVRTRKKVESIENEIAASKGDFSAFARGAMPEERHDWARDLDIFGEGSLYQMIDRSGTTSGRRALLRALLDAPLRNDEMLSYQLSVKELLSLNKHRIDIIAAAALVDASDEEFDRVESWAKRPAPILWSWVRWAVPLTAVYSLSLISLMFAEILPSAIGLLLLMLPLFLAGSQLRKTSVVYNEVGKLSGFFSKLGWLMECISQGEVKTKVALSHRDTVTEGVAAVQQLAKDLSAFDQRNNLIAALITNMLYLAEVRNAYRALQWKRKYGDQLGSWLTSIGEYERLVSTASFAAAFQDQICWPECADRRGVFAEQLQHPALVKKKGVPNDVHIGDGKDLLLITGANMAGKSTYLRTIGVSVILAQIGAPVLATSFSLSSVRLFTSMRTEDSLGSGTSYFLAELKRLAELIERIEDENDTLALLDEILKGTNSIDKEQGSRAFVKQLADRHILAAVATHDVSLTSLAATNDQIRNVHFASEVKEGDLSFDYTLKTGVCDTMNATWLMRSMGIIPSGEAEKNS